MTDLPPETPPENVAEETPPSERADPEEYAPSEEVSSDTGTIYDGTGQTETTPHDLVTDEDDEEPTE